MRQRTVYRFEGPYGYGIYSASFPSDEGEELQEKLFAAHNPTQCGHKNRPNAYDDFTSIQLNQVSDGKFGCPNKRALKTWFKGFVKDFVRCNEIKLMKYQTKNMVIGYTGLQCIFDPENEGVEIKGEELDKFL